MSTNKIIIAILSFVLQASIAFAQNDTIYKVELFEDKGEVEKLSDQIVDEKKQLERRLAELEQQIATQGDVMRVLRTANKERYESSVVTLGDRFEAGERVVSHILKETNQFSLSFSQLQLQDEFSKLSDPTTYSEFNIALKTSLDGLKNRRILPDISEVNDLKSVVPVLNNPIISTTISVASFFLARYNKKAKMNNEAFAKLTCILDYTNSLKSEHQILSARLQELNDKLSAFRENTRTFFGQYLETINYKGGYKKYIEDKNTLNYDFMRQYREQFFNVLLADRDKVGIITFDTNKDDDVLFNIEQVKFYLNQYEQLLTEINDFINSYDKFVQKQKKGSNDACASFYKETSAIFNKIDNQLKTVKDNFNIVFDENQVDKNTKRILFGY